MLLHSNSEVKRRMYILHPLCFTVSILLAFLYLFYAIPIYENVWKLQPSVFLSSKEFENLPLSLPFPLCPETPLAPEKVDLSSKSNYLFFLDNIYSGFDVGESMHCCQDGVPLVLLAKLSSRAPIHGERRSVHEPTEVEVLLKVSYPVLHLILIKIWLHKSNLYVCLREEERIITVLYNETSKGMVHMKYPIVHTWLRMVWNCTELQILQSSFFSPVLTKLISGEGTA